MDLSNKKILITSCGGLGDLIVFTPALRRLKEKYPSCRLTFMTSSKHRDILQGLPYIDKVICIERGKFLGRYRVLKDFWGQDAVVFTDWQPQLLLFSWLFGIPLRAGIPKPGHKLCKYLTKQLENHVFRYTQYAAKTDAMVFGEALDIGLDGSMEKLDVASPSAGDCKAVDQLLQDIGLAAQEPYLLLTPFAGLEQRSWPSEEAARFVELAEAQLGLKVVVTGPPHKADEAARIAKYNLTGRTTTMQLIELVRRAKCLVTPDSGPMHIAGAVGTPVAALFSKDLPSRWAPRQNCVPITLQADCAPCDDETARHCPTVKCMRGITAEMVCEAAVKILQK